MFSHEAILFFFPAEMDTVRLIMFFSGAFVIALVWLRLRSKLKAQIAGQPKITRDNKGMPRDSMLSHEAARKITLDLEEVSRQVNARLGTKIRVLDSLVQEANEKIARLETLLGHEPPKAEGAPVVEVSLEGPPSQKEEVQDETMKEIFRLADAGQDNVEIAKTTGIPHGEVELILSLRKRKAGK